MLQTAPPFQPAETGLPRHILARPAQQPWLPKSAALNQLGHILRSPFTRPFIWHSAPPPFSLSLHKDRASVTYTQASTEHP